MSEKTVLITGGAGFIGSHLIDFLLDKGLSVRVLDDLSTGSMDNIRHNLDNSRFDFIRGNICDTDLDGHFEGVDSIFHLAAIPRVQRSFREPLHTNEVNIAGSLNILEYARKHNVRRVVISTSSSVYGPQDTLPLIETMKPNPLSPYALQSYVKELYSDLYTQVYGMEIVCLRYFNVYGPRQNPHEGYACLIPKSINLVGEGQSPVIHGDGEQRRDFTYVGDVVNATYLASVAENLDKSSNVYNVGYSKSKSVNQVIDVITSGTGVKPVHVDPVIEPRYTEASIEKARRVFGWTPEVDLETGLRRTMEWMASGREVS